MPVAGLILLGEPAVLATTALFAAGALTDCLDGPALFIGRDLLITGLRLSGRQHVDLLMPGRLAKLKTGILVTSAYEVFHAVQNPQETERFISFRHGERLTEALRLGRGVVVVTGHYGNFALLAFALRASSPDAAFIARTSKRRVGPLIGAARAYYRGSLKPLTGMHVLPSSLAGARQTTRLLRRGNLVIIFADLTWGMGSIEVSFLGVPHGVSRAPASLALRTGAVLLPIITRRTPAGRLQILVENPILPPDGESSAHLAGDA